MTRGTGDETSDDRITYVERNFPAQVSRRPNFWSDVEVRRFLIAQLGFLTIGEALERLRADLGPSRVPSKSSVDRFWQRLKRLEARR